MTSQASSRTSKPHHPTTKTSTLDTKTAASSRPSNAEQGHRPSSATSPRTSRWQPKFNRTQSLNEQDMKHQLQQRLTGLEKGRESGFTESEREVKEGERDCDGEMGEGMKG
ncbi:hypothetical protein BDBG_05606 [Blastomyces gilchristii SLH14081]|uniref:Uncharacterized protein n=1 Tax=Blastomyces gilchristii (strain SLH14081) TaxID=559298 RepID=A0A179UPA9_BLAGS|nr:uncharacterized protein BDBG_05606 [Blastomyces gilchristii SLH14081]OAT09915.1 hypothetical protein BDBG_05606 [Blastomyces gilchristii SLH14081]